MTVDTLRFLLITVVSLCTFMQGLYVLTYLVFARWEETPVGRVLMTKAVALFGLLVMILLSVIPGQFPGEDWARLAVAGFVLIAIGRQYLLLVQGLRGQAADDEPVDAMMRRNREGNTPG